MLKEGKRAGSVPFPGAKPLRHPVRPIGVDARDEEDDDIFQDVARLVPR